jgi:hypothetical protein
MKKTFLALALFAAGSAHATQSNINQISESHLDLGVANIQVDSTVRGISDVSLVGLQLGVGHQWTNGVYATFDYTHAEDDVNFSLSDMSMDTEMELDVYQIMLGKQYALNDVDYLFVEVGGYSRKATNTLPMNIGDMNERSEVSDENFVAKVGYKHDFSNGVLLGLSLEHEESETMVGGEIQWSVADNFAIAAYAASNSDEERYGLELRYFPYL